MAKYDVCDMCAINPGVRSAIIDDAYYRSVCDICHNSKNQVSSGHAKWLRSLDAEDHEAEIQQPYNSDGSINTRFAKLYPKQASALFSPEEIDKATRA